MTGNILIVDDQPDILGIMKKTVGALYAITPALSYAAGENACRKHTYDLVILNIDLYRKNDACRSLSCIELPRLGHAVHPPLILTSCRPHEVYPVNLSYPGMLYYIPKPVQPESFRSIVTAILGKLSAGRLTNSSDHVKEAKHLRNAFIGCSEAAEHVRKCIQLYSRDDTPVLIIGETGTGKEIAAQLIHSLSRNDHPYVPVNCSALPPAIIESEIFGHEKGAFTGAVSQRKGILEQAGNGTLFLDEIGDMPLSIQPKFLRVLEERSFTRLGGSRKLQTNIRVTAATNRSLADMIDKKTFREDLYYRINTLPIYIPPLRKRREDIPLLADYYAGKQKGNIAFTDDAYEELMNYSWPGNVRELVNIINRTIIRADPSSSDAELIITEKQITDSLSFEQSILEMYRR